MSKGLSRFAKILVKGGWGIVKPAVDTIEITNENTQKVVDKLETIADKSVDILTDSNPEDAAQFEQLYQEQKFEVLDLGLEIAEDEIKVIPNATTKVVALAALKVIREVIANPTAAYTEKDVIDFLKATYEQELSEGNY